MYISQVTRILLLKSILDMMLAKPRTEVGTELVTNRFVSHKIKINIKNLYTQQVSLNTQGKSNHSVDVA